MRDTEGNEFDLRKRRPPPASWPVEASYPAPRRDGSGVGEYWWRAQLGQDLFLR